MAKQPDAELTVEGKKYSGWKTISVVRSIESLAGSFDLGISDRWARTAERWPIGEEDECELTLLGQKVLNGDVDKRTMSIAKESRSFTVSGRDRAGALVDCSAVLDASVFRDTPILDLAKKLASAFGIEVALQTGLSAKMALPPRDKLAVNPGDTAHHVLERACRMVGLLPISDGDGGILLCRAGATRCTTPLQVGDNILVASSEFDFSQRYYKYIVLSQHAAKIPKKTTKAAAKTTAKAIAAAARTRGEAFDEEVRRQNRVLVINPEDGANLEYAKARAQWEATVRAAKSETVNVTVQGWAQEDGSLWPINALVDVEAREVGVNGSMLIVETKFGLSDSAGRTTEIKLKRPDAFTPQPRIKRPSGASGRWKDLDGGVKVTK